MEDVNTLLVHIEHSKPIEVGNFVTSLNALGSLFSSFAQRNGGSKDMSQAKLYVEKIENNCIDIFLCETVTPTLLHFVENMNIILEFSSYLKKIFDYFAQRSEERPKLTLQDCKSLRDMLDITANDNKGEMTIGAINRDNKINIQHAVNVNFIYGNGMQNLLEKEIEQSKETPQADEIHERQLMTIYQMRGDMSTDTGNLAMIDALSRKRLAVIFETDELKEQILNSDENPTKKAFIVDVAVMTSNGKMAAYKVTNLHEIIPLPTELSKN